MPFSKTVENWYELFHLLFRSHFLFSRVVPDTDLAGIRPTILPDTGYPGNSKYRIFFSKNMGIFSFQQNLPTFLVPISLFFYTHWKGSEKSLLIRSSHYLFNSLTGYPANETCYPAGYRISKKAGYPVQPYFRSWIRFSLDTNLAWIWPINWVDSSM